MTLVPRPSSPAHQKNAAGPFNYVNLSTRQIGLNTRKSHLDLQLWNYLTTPEHSEAPPKNRASSYQLPAIYDVEQFPEMSRANKTPIQMRCDTL